MDKRGLVRLGRSGIDGQSLTRLSPIRLMGWGTGLQ